MWPFSTPYPVVKPPDIGSQTGFPSDSCGEHGHAAVYDYIVVGGEFIVHIPSIDLHPSVRILLLERGGAVDTWASRVPLLSAAYMTPGSPIYRHPVTPMNNLDGRVVNMIRGKALGGGSRINGMVYTRTFAADYNRWSESGRKGWSYDEIEPFFIKSEGFLGPRTDGHGFDGPWKTRLFDRYFLKPTARCVDALKSMGIPVAEDINTPATPAIACGNLHATIDRSGHRCSTFDAFLPQTVALDRRDRLKICTGTAATSLRFEGNRIVGVSFFEELESGPEPGRNYYAHARREVIVCCGAIGSPQLLMLSGIGPKAHLQERGIRVVKDLPGVGSNLEEHVGVSTMYRVPLQDSFHYIRDRPLGAIQEFLKYLFKGEGLFLCPITQIWVFLWSTLFEDDLTLLGKSKDPSQVDSTSPENIPDIEIMPIAFNTTDSEVPIGTGIFSFLAVLLQPRSRGSVRLESNDPLYPPTCDLGFFTDPADRVLMRKAIRISQRIAEQMQAEGYPMEDQNVPDSDSDADLDAFINKSYRTTFHYSSTCRMAPEDDTCPGVVDDRLRVHGVRNLRIADCSILPNILSNHLQAPAVMVAEKCTHMVLEDTPRT
ncbi:alcohol oxidase [Mycena rosella]|uniref:Alcohol oxidase n=1 Tax=Mycena rosella TaxID=1033263 RepID=A0AAD7DMK9_MYCRO|nr:alcohol oxidase [Mycena rosella]